MTLQIGIDYTAAIHQTAGIGRYVRELVGALAGMQNNGFVPQYRLFVAAAGRNFHLPPPAANFSWHPTPITERWLARFWYRLRLPLPVQTWTGPLNLFHAPDFFLPPVRRQTRTLVTVHDLSFVRLPETTMTGMERQLNTWAPLSVQRADHVIAVSEATRQDLIELYGTPPEKISVLYHGVGLAFRPITDAAKLSAVRKKYNLNEVPFVLSVGTIQPRKNYGRLIQALARLDPPVALVIVGSKGWAYESVFNQIAQLGLEKRVHFPGFVDDTDLPALYSAAALFAYPSLYEGFGLPALEAMACGTPVVASNQSALPEVVGQAGLLVDPYSVDEIATALNQILTYDRLRAKLSIAGMAQAAKFTWPKMAAKLIKLYQQLLKKESRG